MDLADWVVLLSITLQFTAAYFAIRMIGVTGRKRAWVLIAGAVTLMGIRRTVSFIAASTDPAARSLDLGAESIALLISVCMVVGLYYLKPVFVEARRTEQRADTLQAHVAALSSLMWDGVAKFSFTCTEEGSVSDCVILEANPAFDRLTEVPVRRKRAQGLADALNLSSRDEAMLYDRLSTLCAEGARQVSGVVLPSRGRWLEGSFFLLEERVFMALLRDITSDREYSDSLELLVNERTEELELANATLERVNKELAASNEVKSRFLAATSHELRTPLNSIIGFSGVLLSGAAGDLTEEQRRQLTMVRASGTSLLRLVNGLLDISRIDAGAVAVDRTAGDLHEFCRETLELVRPDADLKGIGLTFTGCADGCATCRSVLFDRDRVQQVLLNLVGNAVKHIESGDVTLALECGEQTHHIRVTDTGGGIPPELHEAIFDEFERAERTGRVTGGGLGLPISRRLARLMGGDVVLERSTPAGTTFTFTLPRE